MLAFLGLLPLGMLVIGMPVFLALLATVTLTVVIFLPLPATLIPQTMFGSLGNIDLLSIPFFIFAGALMARGSLARRLVDFAISLFGTFPGSTPITTVGATAFYGAVSGSTAATVATIGPIFYPRLRESGYSTKYAAGLITCSGYIGNIIPPSIALVLYAASAEQSVLKLFTAGIIPGIVLALVIAVFLISHGLLTGQRSFGPPDLSRMWSTFKASIWALGAPALIFGGLYGGVFSPTEAAGVVCVYIVFVSVFVLQDMPLKVVWQTAMESMYLTAQVLLIVAAAGVFSWLLATTGAIQFARGAIEYFATSPWSVLLAINILLLLVGCLVDPGPAILILTPVLLPIAQANGVDPIHFGIIMVTNLSIGTFTPPIGINIFVARSVLNVPVGQIYAGLVPFILVSIIGLMIITYVPSLSLWLVRAIG